MATAVGAREQEYIWFIDNLVQVHVDGEASGGAFTLCEFSGPQGDMPPLHVHSSEDEIFYAVEGNVTLFAGHEQIELKPGEAAAAPRGVPHTYRVESAEARFLVLTSPAGFEQFVREMGEPAPARELPPTGRPFDPGALAAAAAGYGIEILGPPGALPDN